MIALIVVILKMTNQNMNAIKYFAILLLVIATSFMPGPTITPEKHHNVTATLHFVLDEKTTIFYDYSVLADTVINLTGQIPKYREMYIIIRTK